MLKIRIYLDFNIFCPYNCVKDKKLRKTFLFLVQRGVNFLNKEIIENISKEDFLESLSKLFYDKNFGIKSKSEIELEMFRQYFLAAKQLATDKNGITDENKISDFKIGQQLGIAPGRVKNLRLKMELQFSEDYQWQEALRKILCNKNNLDIKDGYIRINVRSKYLFNAIRDWVEDQGEIIEITLNNNEVKLEKNHMIELLAFVLPVDDYNLIISKISEETNDSPEKVKKDIASVIKKYTEIGKDVSEIVLNLSKAFNPQSETIEIIKSVIPLFVPKENK